MEFMLAFVLGVGAAVATFERFFSRSARIKRMLRQSRTLTTDSFRHGAAGKLEGQVRYLVAPLCAPLSGRPCSYYEATIEAEAGDMWTPIAHEVRSVDFLLEDSTGQALVRMDNAEAVVPPDVSSRVGVFSEPSDALVSFLRRHGISRDRWFTERQLRYREGVIAEGARVAARGYGTFEANPDPRTAKGGYRDNASLLVLHGTRAAPLFISNDTAVLRGDG